MLLYEMNDGETLSVKDCQLTLQLIDRLIRVY